MVDSDPRTREWFPFNVYSTQRQKQVRQNNEVTQLTLIQVLEYTTITNWFACQVKKGVSQQRGANTKGVRHTSPTYT